MRVPSFQVVPSKSLADLFDRRVAAHEILGTASVEHIDPLEAECVAGAVRKRRDEFAAGRVCAREGLAQCGIQGHPLLKNESRDPAWPPGIAGSITHTDGFCGAVVCTHRTYRGLGIDVECAGRVTKDLESKICVEEERQWLDREAEDRRALMATLVFSAKEAFFKCQFALTSQWIDFSMVTITVADPGASSGEFVLRPNQELEVFGSVTPPLVGRFVASDDHMMTGIAIE